MTLPSCHIDYFRVNFLELDESGPSHKFSNLA